MMAHPDQIQQYAERWREELKRRRLESLKSTAFRAIGALSIAAIFAVACGVAGAI